MIRALRSARRSAVKARSQAANQLQSLLITAPEELRRGLRGLKAKELAAVAARFRMGKDPADLQAATRFALRSVARRYEALSEEIAQLERQLGRLVAEVAPGLISCRLSARTTPPRCLLWPERILSAWRCEASFASVCERLRRLAH